MVYDLKCDCLNNPLGITDKNPYFTFAVNTDFSFFKVCCASTKDKLEAEHYDIWESAFQKKQVGNISYRGASFPERSIIYWKVFLYDKNKRLICKSDTKSFETGIFRFTAKWVGSDKPSQAAPLFHQDFILKNEKVKRARLYISGLGYYRSFINGIETDNLYFKPLVSDYDKRNIKGWKFFDNCKKTVYYNTLDIKNLLCKENSISVLVGNGWYNHRDKLEDGEFFYGTPRAVFEIWIDYEDGSTDVFRSGIDTKVKDSHITKNSMFTGEIADFRLFDDNDYLYPAGRGFTSAKICRRPAGKPEGTATECDKKVKEFTARKISSCDSVQIFDFGQNHAGVLRIKVKGKVGERVSILLGEEIKNGRVDCISSGWGMTVQREEFILGREEQEFSNSFAFHGYRFAEVEGAVEVCEFTSSFISCLSERRGKFICSDETINKIDELYIPTQQSNAHGGIPSDCPHREKRGYTGDGQITCETVLYHFHSEAFYRKWLKDIFDAQDYRGFIPHTAPFSGGAGGPAWGSAGAIVLEKYYDFSGDVATVRRYYNGLKKWVGFLDTCHDGDGIIVRENDEIVLGDWFCPVRNELPFRFVNSIYFIKCARILKRFSKLLKKADEGYCDAIIGRTAKSLNEQFYNDGVYAENKNGAGALALDAGIVPETDKEKVLKEIVRHYDDCKHFDTGIMATPVVLKVLFENGYCDLAIDLLTADGFPSYRFMIENDATTLWECWEKDIGPIYSFDEKTYYPGYPVSYDHPMFGSVTSQFYSYIAGLDLNGLNSGKVDFNLYNFSGLHSASASVDTLFGRFAIDWEKTSKRLDCEIEFPENFSAELKLKFGDERRIPLKGGKQKYSFEVDE